MKYSTPNDFTMREPCMAKRLDKPKVDGRVQSCGCEIGHIDTRNGQDCVWCSECGSYCYNAPKTETGRSVRSASTVHKAIKPKVRAKTLFRANGQCELCGKHGDGVALHVGHVISVNIGLSNGLTEIELNDQENLVALCDECNLGIGDEPMPLRFLVRVLKARLKYMEPSRV